MEPYNHSQFILKPQLAEIELKVASFAALGDSIVVYSIQNDFLNSLFMQLTGAQEQKSKCICWMLAQYDLEYRRRRFFDGWNLSECSRLSDKNNVYGDLLNQTRKVLPDYHIFADIPDKQVFVQSLHSKLYNIFENTNLVAQRKHEYETFKEIAQNLNLSNIDGENKLFKDGETDIDKMKDNSPVLLSAIYKLLYVHRNRNAHNTISYQENLPDIKNLLNTNVQRYSNIFLYIAELVIIDELYMRVYRAYLDTVNSL